MNAQSGRLRAFRKAASWDAASTENAGASSDATIRTCPYCGSRIDLRRCDVVATAPGSKVNSNKFDDQGSSGSKSENYILLQKGARSETHQKPASFREWLQAELESSIASDQSLVPVTELASPNLIPRRRCESCEHLLPVQLDTRDARVLAIVGINGAGKTHFLAQSLLEATRFGSLRRFGFTELAATGVDNTNEILQRKYYYNLQRTRELFDITPEAESPKQFTFGASINGKAYLVVTHDVSGEAISSASRRAIEFGFLRRADAMIFLLDPMQFESVLPHIPGALQVPYRSTYQIDLLRECIDELHQSHREEIPISVVISKVDLLRNFCGITGSWEQPTTSDWITEARQIDQDVRLVLKQLGEEEVIHLMRRHPRHLFQAVSALGAHPANGRLQAGGPLRCSDPLGASLYRMALLSSQR
jgi:Double-GTPase 2